MQITVGIITVSDRASEGAYEDLGGPALKEAALAKGWNVLSEAIVPDEIGRVQETIRAFSAQGCGLILTTGGTGIAARDVTPEAIRGLMRVELPGFGAVVGPSLVIALPGKPSGAVECLGFVVGAIPHGVALAQRVPTSC